MAKAKNALSMITWIFVLCVVSACSLPVKRPTPPWTASEQWLISNAIERSVGEANLELPEGTLITLDTSGLTKDQKFMGDVVASWLGKQGLVVRNEEKDATYRVQVIVQSLGATRSVKLFGLGSGQAQAMFIGIRVPELAIWKRDRQRGVARFYMNIYEANTRKFIRSTKWYEGTVSRTSYTLLFIITWSKSDLAEPPRGAAH